MHLAGKVFRFHPKECFCRWFEWSVRQLEVTTATCANAIISSPTTIAPLHWILCLVAICAMTACYRLKMSSECGGLRHTALSTTMMPPD